MAKREQRCETCRFWADDLRDGDREGDDPDLDHSECHRFPPPSGDYSQYERFFIAHFPMTRAYDWCGEWKPKE